MKFDKNTIIGGILMVLLLVGFSWYQGDQMKKRAAAEQLQLDSLAKIEAAKPKVDTLQVTQIAAAVGDSNAVLSAGANEAKYGILASATFGNDQEVVLENHKVKVTLSTKGGLLKAAELLDNYKVYGKNTNVQLWDDSLSKMKLVFNLYGKGTFKSDEFVFTPSSAYADAKTAAQQLSMKLTTADPTKYIELIYTLTPDAYNVGMKVNVVGMGNEMDLSTNPMKLEWYAVGNANEKGIGAERSKSSVFYRENEEDRDYLSETSADDYITEKPLTWMAFKQDYFSSGVYSTQGFLPGCDLRVSAAQDSSHNKYYWANLGLPLKAETNTSFDLNFYLGPNDYAELNKLDVPEFHRIIDYGWSIIGVVNRYMVRPLFWFFSSFIGSWGLIILLVTLVIKTVLFPITWKNFLSSAKMRVLKPEIDDINKKYEGKAPGEKQTAMMALYRQTGVNPFAGCIPVLIQMPVLYAMFRFFPAEIVLRGKSFLWADDLAAYDSIFSWTQNIPVLSSIYGNHISGFTIMMCISTFIYTRMSMSAQPAMQQQPGMPNMKVMMNLFTVMMLFFFNNQPSGLALYYFIANMVSIGQMWAIKKYFIDEDAIRAKIDNNKKKPAKKSGFMQRLEEAQKAQKVKLGTAKR